MTAVVRFTLCKLLLKNLKLAILYDQPWQDRHIACYLVVSCNLYAISLVIFRNYGRFATLPVRPLDVSPPGRFAPWTIRPLDVSPPGPFAPTQWTIRPLRCWCNETHEIIKRTTLADVNALFISVITHTVSTRHDAWSEFNYVFSARYLRYNVIPSTSQMGNSSVSVFHGSAQFMPAVHCSVALFDDGAIYMGAWSQEACCANLSPFIRPPQLGESALYRCVCSFLVAAQAFFWDENHLKLHVLRLPVQHRRQLIDIKAATTHLTIQAVVPTCRTHG